MANTPLTSTNHMIIFTRASQIQGQGDISFNFNNLKGPTSFLGSNMCLRSLDFKSVISMIGDFLNDDRRDYWREIIIPHLALSAILWH